MAKVVHIFSVIIPTQVQANSSGAEFLLRQIQVHEENEFVIACLRPSQNVTD